MSNPSRLNARFCPWCGLERLERDSYRSFKEMKHEFICQSCGFAFRILASSRVVDANRMMAHDRKLRVPNKVTAAMAEDQFNAVCKRKWKEFKRAQVMEAQRKTAEYMKAWMQSEEATTLRTSLSESAK